MANKKIPIGYEVQIQDEVYYWRGRQWINLDNGRVAKKEVSKTLTDIANNEIEFNLTKTTDIKRPRKGGTTITKKLEKLKRASIRGNSLAWLENKMKHGVDKKWIKSTPQLGRLYLTTYGDSLAKEEKQDIIVAESPLILVSKIYTKKGTTYVEGFSFFHIPVDWRIQILQSLMTIAKGRGDASTRIKLSYNMLSKLKHSKKLEVTFRKYHLKRFTSRFHQIPSSEFESAVTLPLGNFINAKTGSKVTMLEAWKNSKKRLK